MTKYFTNRMSSYESCIISLLQREGIYFVREKTFQDLRRYKLRYDFYLPTIDTLIEIDGQQHFHQIKHFQKLSCDFTKQQEYDRIKNSYALANSIQLIRIPYWEFDNGTIQTFQDLFQSKFIVKSKWHNDYLKEPN